MGALLLTVGLHFLWPWRQLFQFPLTLVGFLPIAAGVVLNLSADRALNRQNTTVKPFEESRVLITSGVYRLSRNPMYLGMALIILGVAVFLGSATPFLIAILLPLLLHWKFINPEEAMLSRSFGKVFTEYRTHTRKWI